MENTSKITEIYNTFAGSLINSLILVVMCLAFMIIRLFYNYKLIKNKEKSLGYNKRTYDILLATYIFSLVLYFYPTQNFLLSKLKSFSLLFFIISYIATTYYEINIMEEKQNNNLPTNKLNLNFNQ
jgi:hypothetical protein